MTTYFHRHGEALRRTDKKRPAAQRIERVDATYSLAFNPRLEVGQERTVLPIVIVLRAGVQIATAYDQAHGHRIVKRMKHDDLHRTGKAQQAQPVAEGEAA